MTVLEHWGIQSTEDFGNIIFNLVENQVLSKTLDDHIDQFRNGFNGGSDDWIFANFAKSAKKREIC